jgi:hypothetical protein
MHVAPLAAAHTTWRRRDRLERTIGENPTTWHRLLRACRERPSRTRGAEKRDERTASYLIELHSVPVSQGRTAGYRLDEAQSAGIGTSLHLFAVGEGRLTGVEGH